MKVSKEYYAVIFTSHHTGKDKEAYASMSDRMLRLASKQPGFLGIESARNEDGLGITVSYWESEESIEQWKKHSEHLVAQQGGKEKWYENFSVRIAKINREYHFRIPSKGEQTI